MTIEMKLTNDILISRKVNTDFQDAAYDEYGKTLIVEHKMIYDAHRVTIKQWLINTMLLNNIAENSIYNVTIDTVNQDVRKLMLNNIVSIESTKHSILFDLQCLIRANKRFIERCKEGSMTDLAIHAFQMYDNNIKDLYAFIIKYLMTTE